MTVPPRFVPPPKPYWLPEEGDALPPLARSRHVSMNRENKESGGDASASPRSIPSAGPQAEFQQYGTAKARWQEVERIVAARKAAGVVQSTPIPSPAKVARRPDPFASRQTRPPIPVTAKAKWEEVERIVKMRHGSINRSTERNIATVPAPRIVAPAPIEVGAGRLSAPMPRSSRRRLGRVGALAAVAALAWALPILWFNSDMADFRSIAVLDRPASSGVFAGDARSDLTAQRRSSEIPPPAFAKTPAFAPGSMPQGFPERGRSAAETVPVLTPRSGAPPAEATTERGSPTDANAHDPAPERFAPTLPLALPVPPVREAPPALSAAPAPVVSPQPPLPVARPVAQVRPLVAIPEAVGPPPTESSSRAANLRCRAIIQKVVLGEETSYADRSYLRNGCGARS